MKGVQFAVWAVGRGRIFANLVSELSQLGLFLTS